MKISIFVLSKINGRVEKFLFIKKIDEAKARWIGKSLTKDEASNLSGITNILYLDEFDDFIHSIIFNVNNVYLDSIGVIVSKKEKEGPLGRYFPSYIDDYYINCDSFEKAQVKLSKMAIKKAPTWEQMKM